ncbi:hypothetical protein SDJN03_28298, partial [Cucurbita argyrosperma subsp. sororia]
MSDYAPSESPSPSSPSSSSSSSLFAATHHQTHHPGLYPHPIYIAASAPNLHCFPNNPPLFYEHMGYYGGLCSTNRYHHHHHQYGVEDEQKVLNWQRNIQNDNKKEQKLDLSLHL